MIGAGDSSSLGPEGPSPEVQRGLKGQPTERTSRVARTSARWHWWSSQGQSPEAAGGMTAGSGRVQALSPDGSGPDLALVPSLGPSFLSNWEVSPPCRAAGPISHKPASIRVFAAGIHMTVAGGVGSRQSPGVWGLGDYQQTVILEVVERRFPRTESMRWHQKGPRKVSVTPGWPGYLKVGILKGRDTTSPPRCLKGGHKSITKALGGPDSESPHM